MRLDAEALRSRRLELGLSQRALARAARVSQPLITRLEITGNADRLECRMLDRILDGLSLSLVSVVAEPERPAPYTLVRRNASKAAGLAAPTNTDLQLLLLALRGELTTRRAALRANGNVGLQQLRNAGLVDIVDGEVVTSSISALIFQTPTKSCQGPARGEGRARSPDVGAAAVHRAP